MPRGRPKGARNRATAEIKSLCQEHGPKMVARLVAIASNAKTPEGAAVAVIREILDRGYGKPTQAHEHGGLGGGPIAVDLTGATDEQLAALASLFGPLAAAGADADGDPGGAGAA
ncbi:hypothetical protein [Methylobacterium mesophilicum]|uniref:hypothetical protein n=1 Tax=Methylobacterium mesophilicum TaxID=39956 RepID=UPI002F2D917C